MSVIRAAGSMLIITVPEPLAIGPPGGMHMQMSVARAAGRLPISVWTCLTTEMTPAAQTGQAIGSVRRAANSLAASSVLEMPRESFPRIVLCPLVQLGAVRLQQPRVFALQLVPPGGLA